jgi:hypothetical protein
MTAAAIQLDLFGQVLGAEQQRHLDALTCLRDAASDALEVVTQLSYKASRDVRDLHYGGGWAFVICEAGLRFRRDDSPMRVVTWDELTTLIGPDPRRTEVAAWVDGLPMPRWKLLMRPHELWPEPEGWHTSYFCHDHVDRHWPQRRRMWQLVLDLLGDAIAAVESGVVA